VGRFRFSKTEFASFRASLIAQRSNSEMRGTQLAMRDVDNWPGCLPGRVDKIDVRCGFEAYRLREFEIAIDTKSCTAYVWTA
jgi:hypothetical protein